MASPKVIARIEPERFGGSRIDGVASVVLFSDEVVIATAWSDSTPGIKGDVFTFRGFIAKGHPFGNGAGRWFLRDVNGQYLLDCSTRKEAVERAGALARMKAFRALNEAEAATAAMLGQVQ